MDISKALSTYPATNTNHIYLVLKDHVTHNGLRDFSKTFDFVLSCEGWAITDFTSNPMVAKPSEDYDRPCTKNNVIAWLIQQGEQVAVVRSAPNIEPLDGKWHFTLVYLKGDLVGEDELELCL